MGGQEKPRGRETQAIGGKNVHADGVSVPQPMKTLTCSLLICGILPAFSEEVTVRNTAQLKAALGAIKEGTVLKIAPGEYSRGQKAGS